jgi:uncharacterized membrane protein YcfT
MTPERQWRYAVVIMRTLAFLGMLALGIAVGQWGAFASVHSQSLANQCAVYANTFSVNTLMAMVAGVVALVAAGGVRWGLERALGGGDA